MVGFKTWGGLLLAWVGLVGCGGVEPAAENVTSEVLESQAQEARDGHESRKQLEWMRRPRGAGDDAALAVAHDRDGNLVVLGSFQHRLEHVPGTLTGATDRSLWLAKYRQNGELLWKRAFDVVSDFPFLFGDYGTLEVTTDRDRNILIAGDVTGAVDFGGGPVEGGFLVKLEPDGDHRWTREFVVSPVEGGFYSNFGNAALVTDSDDHIYLSAVVSGRVDFGTGPIETRDLHTRSVLVRFTPSGRTEWTRAFSEDSGEHAEIAIDSHDDVYLAGRRNITPLLRKVSSDGRERWVRYLEDVDGTGADGGGVTVAVHGNRVVMGGFYEGVFVFRGKRFPAFAPDTDGFLVAYTRDGEERWARNLGRAVVSVAMDPHDGLAVTGTYDPGDDLGLGPVPSPDLRFNLFVAKYDRIDGAARWVQAFPAETTVPADIAVTRDGEVTAVGSYRSPVDFGEGTVTPEGESDAFILHFRE